LEDYARTGNDCDATASAKPRRCSPYWQSSDCQSSWLWCIGNRRGLGDSLQSAGKAADKLQGDSETFEVIKTSTKVRA
jgi:hypothetical protein